MIFHFFYFLFPSYLLNKIEVVSLKNKFNENVDDGYDFRYEKNVDIDYTILNNFDTQFLKNEILMNIEDKDISSLIRVKMIEDNLNIIFNKSSHYLHNLLEGGLMNDFNFNIDELL
jgi:hypothetical protein